MFTTTKMTLDDVIRYMFTLDFDVYLKVYGELIYKGILHNDVILRNAYRELTEYEEKEFMLIKIKYS